MNTFFALGKQRIYNIVCIYGISESIKPLRHRVSAYSRNHGSVDFVTAMASPVAQSKLKGLHSRSQSSIDIAKQTQRLSHLGLYLDLY